ncbi:MAG: SIS domain-containing protein [Cyanobacteria bacterium SIG30]|nr:SIS domain-containing protein [Cyanobacteria bacterium SIG30]
MKSIMEQEIAEQPSLFKKIVDEYIKDGEVLIDFPTEFKKIRFIASGSSYNCAGLAEKFFKNMAGYDATCEFASEFIASKKNKIDKDALYFFISQSGRTVDTLAVLEEVKKAGAKTFALVNVEDSKMFEEADYKLAVGAGVENAIAATKSFTACILFCWLLAVKASGNSKEYTKYVNEEIEEVIEKAINNTDAIVECAGFLATQRNFPIVGYDYYYAIAKEGALKTKETSFIDANAYALGEFIHGHVALLNEENAVIEIFGEDLGAFEVKNLNKIKDKYSPKRVTITDFESDLNGDYSIIIPKCKNEITKYLAIVVTLQVLAFNIAKKLNRNIDNPNGLSKVVE